METVGSSKDGENYINSAVIQPYVANTWYPIELRDINWISYTFDVYVDGVLGSASLSFRGNTSQLARRDLHNYDLKALIRGRWKLIQDRKRNTIELYDMTKDPRETHNVAEKNKDVARQLSSALDVFSHNGEIAFGLFDFRRLAKKIRGGDP